MTPQFRDFCAEDLPRILDLWTESWTEVYAGIDFSARRPWFSNHISAWNGNGGVCRIILAGEPDEIAGFILVNPSSGHLDQICVSVRWKGKKIAAALLEEARRISPQGLRLDVNVMNLRAIRFYEREGFLKTGEGVNPLSGLPILHYRWQP